MESLYDVPPLRMARIACELRPEGRFTIPVEERGNLLRGAFGALFRQLVCLPNCVSYEQCPRAGSCPHETLFAPRWPAGAQIGLETPPKAFVFRSTLEPDPEFSSERPLRFELRLFGNAIEAADLFLRAFALWARHGDRQRRVHLASAWSQDWEGRSRVQLAEAGCIAGAKPVALRFDRCFNEHPDGSTATVTCMTPLWLKEGNHDLRTPTISALVQRVRDRLSLLCSFYENEEWQANYGEIGQRARSARILDEKGEWMHHSRYSSRTDKAMPLGGYIGKVTCAGIDPALWPLLRIGEEIHAGRHAVWGHGWYRIE